MSKKRSARQSQQGIGCCIEQALERYMRDLDGEQPSALHAMVIGAAERTVLAFVLKQADGNQSLAAKMLGINRNTLRRKLIEYDLSRPPAT